MNRPGRQRGAIYLLTLSLVAALGFGLARFGTLWSTALQREREAELLFVGGEYARAIASYRAALPGEPAQGPERLGDLLLDPRFPFVRRHLRRLYPDPMSGEVDWIIERRAGRITGLRSQSTRPALRSSGLPLWVSVSGVGKGEPRHTDWLFHLDDSVTHVPGAPSSPLPDAPATLR